MRAKISSGATQKRVAQKMGWETRGNGRYFYSKLRVGSSVVSTYAGSGVLACELERLGQHDRAVKEHERRRRQRMREHERELDAEVERICRMVTTLADAELLASGFHQHRRQWRRMKEGNE